MNEWIVFGLPQRPPIIKKELERPTVESDRSKF